MMAQPQSRQDTQTSEEVIAQVTQEQSITYALSLWSRQPPLPLIETAPRLPHTLLFVPGLKDTFGTVPYIEKLAIAVAPFGFNIVQPQLSSSLGGYGVSSIEADAQEIALVMRHLRTRKTNPKHPDAKVVVMGHSTGCQDMAQLLCFDRAGISVDGAILQAPVSDREDFEKVEAEGGEARETLALATSLVESGKGAQLLPRGHNVPRRTRDIDAVPASTSHQVNVPAVNDPAITAYRYWSLHAKGGDDDYFSTDLSEQLIQQLWQDMLGKDRFVTALLGAEDEYGPTTMSAAALADRWSKLVERTAPHEAKRFRAIAVPGANHKVQGQDAQEVLIAEVCALLLKVLGEEDDGMLEPHHSSNSEAHKGHRDTTAVYTTDGASRGKEQYPASFDQVVELISTGRADSIPGIKDIPLQLNETVPSEASMERPLKPWERTQ